MVRRWFLLALLLAVTGCAEGGSGGDAETPGVSVTNTASAIPDGLDPDLAAEAEAAELLSN